MGRGIRDQVVPSVTGEFGLAEAVAELTAAPVAEAEARFAIRRIKADKFNEIRTRVEVTPSTCERCGLDMAVVNKLPPYGELSEPAQEAMRAVLAEHIKTIHTAADLQVATASELSREWLGKG